MCSRERNCICDSGVVGNARPCQGRDRGFEPRLSLYSKRDIQTDVSFFERAPSGARSSSVSASRLHFVSVVSKPTSSGCRETVRAKPRSTGPRAPSIALIAKRSHSPALRLLVSASRLHFVSVVSKPTSTGCRETVRAEPTSTGRLAPVYRFIRPIRGSKFERLHFVSVVSKPTSTGCRETVRAKPRSTGPRAPSIALTTKRIFERSLLSESIKKVTWGQQSQHIQYLST